jgi:hypothetical protein
MQATAKTTSGHVAEVAIKSASASMMSAVAHFPTVLTVTSVPTWRLRKRNMSHTSRVSTGSASHHGRRPALHRGVGRED